MQKLNFLLVCVASLLLPSLLSAQAETETPPLTVQQPEKQKLKAFLDLRKQIRTKQQLIDLEFGNVPIGFPNLQKKAEERIATLEKELHELRKQVKPLTLEAYLEDPNNNKTVNNELYNIIKSALSPTKDWHTFDPNTAQEFSRIVMDNGVDSPQIKFLAFRASVALHDFQTAETLLNDIKSSVELNPEITINFEQLKDKWLREFEIRRIEMANNDLPRVKLETSEGDIILELFEDHAPQTVGNFVSLVEKQFYDGQIFHLVQPGKYAQTGCPDGNGRGGPGYKIYCETDREKTRDHFAGCISMSHPPGTKNTGDSKFFILQQPDTSLDGEYTVFGRVIQGMDVVYRLKECDKTDVVTDDRPSSKITTATVLRKRQHPYVPTKVTD